MKLFVYGLLRDGQRMNDMLKDCNCLGTGFTTGTLYHNGMYPIMVLNDKNRVFGEVYVVTDKILDFIDSVEFGAGYKRKQVPVNTGFAFHDCEAYYMDSYDGKEIPSGDFNNISGPKFEEPTDGKEED